MTIKRDHQHATIRDTLKQPRLGERIYMGVGKWLIRAGVRPLIYRALGERFIGKIRNWFLRGAYDSGNVWDRLVKGVENKTIRGWLDWEFVEINHIRLQVSGDRDVYYTEYLFDKYFRHSPPKRCLSLGCGGGNLERGLLRMGFGEHFDAIDSSEGSIKLARELAAKEGFGERIHYTVGDINRLRLEENQYDFVIAKMALHHFDNLDHIYEEVRRSLKSNGIFCFNDFIGPTRYQWTDKQLEICNEILQLLPEKYRWSLWEKRVIDSIGRPTIEDMLRVDPTEAIRSAEIIPKLTRYFDIIERKDYGGTILHLLFNHIMDNFDTDSEEQATIVNLICWVERRLLREGVMPSDFTFVVARPKKT
jgi:ubiquinone/menaquinone biosynthesis C-methylase UbiE